MLETDSFLRRRGSLESCGSFSTGGGQSSLVCLRWGHGGGGSGEQPRPGRGLQSTDSHTRRVGRHWLLELGYTVDHDQLARRQRLGIAEPRAGVGPPARPADGVEPLRQSARLPRAPRVPSRIAVETPQRGASRAVQLPKLKWPRAQNLSVSQLVCGSLKL